MKHFFFYGKHPRLSGVSAKDLSRDGYEGRLLFQSRRGDPVVVSRHKTMDIWKVGWGFSSVFFRTEAEALAYCKGRFPDADGQVV